MELRHLRHFLAVAEELHMGRAAQRLGMAQPPLSQSIARLEAELGVRLFERAHRRLELTRAGAAMVEHAREAVGHAEEGAALARGAAEGLAGEIRIGVVSAALYEHVPELLSRIRSELPELRPRLLELPTNEQMEAMSAGRLDLGFVHPPLGTDAALQIRELPAERFVAVVPDEGDAAGVSLGDIARRGLILFPAAQGPALHAQILDAFTRAELNVRVVQEAGRALTMMSLVAAGFGVALLPACTRRVGFRGVRFAEITDGDLLPLMPLAIIAPRRPRPPVIDRVLAIIARTVMSLLG